MTLSFTARIDGKQIHCQIGSAEPVSAPVFCFSLMAPPCVVSGGVMIRQVAGYGEVALPDIPAGGADRAELFAAAEIGGWGAGGGG